MIDNVPLLRNLIAACLAAYAAYAHANEDTLWIEAERFVDSGGWTVDTQFVAEMGSAYLLASGAGTPVAPARTSVRVPEAGRWRAWVRTRNWLPEFSPGTFAVEINGKRSETLGNLRKHGWNWQNAGEFDLPAGDAEIRLLDLTGWFGRCDAVVLKRGGGTCFVDATGDGWLGFYAGAVCEKDALSMSGSLVSTEGRPEGHVRGFRRERDIRDRPFVAPPWVYALKTDRPPRLADANGALLEHPHSLDELSDGAFPTPWRTADIRSPRTYGLTRLYREIPEFTIAKITSGKCNGSWVRVHRIPLEHFPRRDGRRLDIPDPEESFGFRNSQDLDPR